MCELTGIRFAHDCVNLTTIKLVSYLNGCRGRLCFYLIFWVEPNFTMIKNKLYCEHFIYICMDGGKKTLIVTAVT